MGENKKFNIKEISKKNKMIIIGVSTILFLLCFIGYNSYGICMPDKVKTKKINNTLAKKNYNKAKKLTNKYYSKDDDKTKAVREFMIFNIESCEKYNVGNFSEIIEEHKQLTQNYNDMTALKVEKVEIVSNDSFFNDIETTIFNQSDKVIDYVKLNLFFKDNNGNIIDSDWTHNASEIMPGARKVIKKMVPKSLKFDTVTSKLNSFTFK